MIRTLLHFLKALARLLALLLLSPLLLMWWLARWIVHRAALSRGLRRAGVPKAAARQLCRRPRYR